MDVYIISCQSSFFPFWSLGNYPNAVRQQRGLNKSLLGEGWVLQPSDAPVTTEHWPRLHHAAPRRDHVELRLTASSALIIF